MDPTELLYSFDPSNSGDRQWAFWSILLAVIFLGGSLFLLWRPRPGGANRNFRLLFAMLAFFGFLIFAGTGVFSLITARKIGPVKLYRDHLVSPYGEVPYDQIRSARLIREQRPSLLNPQQGGESYLLLLIEEKSGKAHLLSEKNYPVGEVLERIREVTGE